MERPIGFWLKLVDQLIDETSVTVLDEHGVTRRQWQLLNVIAARPSTFDELTEEVAPFISADDDAELGEYIAELVESEWITVFDERYRMTERGTHAFERLGSVIAQLRSRMSEGVSEEEYDTTVRTLERMARNLGWDASDRSA